MELSFCYTESGAPCKDYLVKENSEKNKFWALDDTQYQDSFGELKLPLSEACSNGIKLFPLYIWEE